VHPPLDEFGAELLALFGVAALVIRAGGTRQDRLLAARADDCHRPQQTRWRIDEPVAPTGSGTNPLDGVFGASYGVISRS
jgi:hypothetical protein